MQNTKVTQKRITAIDALRGFALLGILIVNIFVFHAPYAHYGSFYFVMEGVELSVVENMVFFCAGKFMFIFAFLFGYGCWMQYEKYSDKIAFRNFWWRRMSLLAVFGILHLLFLSFGDILLPYALLGMTLPFFLGFKNRTLLLCFLGIHFIPAAEFILRQVIEYEPVFTSSKYSLQEYIALNTEGSFWDLLQLRLYDFGTFRNEKLIMYIPKEWSLFLAGIWASRKKMLEALDTRKGLIFVLFGLFTLVLWYFFGGAIQSAFDFENSIFQALLFALLITIRELIHGFFYVFGFVLLWKWNFFRTFLKPLQFVGKMSLTNYLGQSVICAFLFSSFGLALYGSLKPSQLVITAFVIFISQMIFSYFWLSKFDYGPLEGLWRKWSYRK